MSQYTKEQIHNLIEAHLDKHRKMINAKELSDIIGKPTTSTQAMIASYSKDHLRKFIVTPSGKVCMDGVQLWKVNSKGSMTTASYRYDAEIDAHIIY